MHALFVTVRIAAGQFDGASTSLKENVVPRVSKAPGFVKGYWTVNDTRTEGASLAVFKTRENADAAANMARSTPLPPGVTINSVDVREVVAEA